MRLVLTHITIVAVTIFLHRHQAHHSLDLNPCVAHCFRLWLSLTTGMVTRECATEDGRRQRAPAIVPYQGVSAGR